MEAMVQRTYNQNIENFNYPRQALLQAELVVDN